MRRSGLMRFFVQLGEALSDFGSLFLVLGLVFAYAILRYGRKVADVDTRSRLVIAAWLVALHFVLMIAGVALEAAGWRSGGDLVLVGKLLGALSRVTIAGVVLFEGIVRRIRPDTPRIVPDVIMLVAGAVVLARTSSQHGVELSGIIATSAVLTAVIGLALQDTLGNVFSGVALQLDSSFSVGDWIKIGDVNGRVSEIRWRYTAIETRNWETILVPNNVVTKSQVVIFGRRSGQPELWRRWVYFNVDYRRSPTEVIAAVEGALRAQPIENVAAHPEPNCIVLELGESVCRYGVRYWLTNFAVDEPTDSVVRTRVFYALSRAKIPLAIPAQTVFVKSEDRETLEEKKELDLARRIEALSQIDLFRDLSESERAGLAHDLHRAPFTRGETLTKQGSIAHYLYTIVSGEVAILLREGGVEREVGRLGAGQFFGEMALLTGERRRATVVALTDVECYRLDASAFRTLLEGNEALADKVASVLAEREVSLHHDKQRMDEHARASLLAKKQSAFLGKIRSFFGVDEA